MVSSNTLKERLTWTKSKARLTLIQTNPGKYNWVFIPGGPGLGSEYLRDLTALLNLPGKTWHFDFPGDGSNVSDERDPNIDIWFESLQQITEALENLILVGHSTGGMLILAAQGLEDKIRGLVLISSAPDVSWQTHFSKYVATHPILEVEKLRKLYEKVPSNDLLRDLTLACAPYVSMPQNVDKIISTLKKITFQL